MTELLRIENGQVGVSSKVIADSFGKIHRDVLRAIDGLECSKEFRLRNFAHSQYVSSQGKTLPCVQMTRDGFCFLAMGFTGANAAIWKEAFIDAFNQLESVVSAKNQSAMESLGEAIALMESDKEKASLYGKALATWRKVRKTHIEAITAAHDKAQLILNFGASK